jgi:DDE superfamily endonuclease
VGPEESNARNSRRPVSWTVSTNPAIGTVPCVVEDLVPWRSPPTMFRSSNRSLGVGHCPGIKSNELRSSSLSRRGSRSSNWPSAPNAIRRPFGGSAVATRTPACPISWNHRNGLGDRPGFPPLQRAQIVRLACLEPIAKGLHITHWTSQDLARQAVEDGIVPAISDRTVQTILDQVDLQPHRTRYWRTSRIDAQFKQRAEKILWCYTNAERLARRGFWVVCADEKPNFQVLERHPIRHSIPGSIAQREFDYTRHGTVNILVFLIVHSGRMEAACFDAKSAERYIRELSGFRHRHRHLRGIYLIHDNDPTHTAARTSDYLAGCSGWWRSRFTPVHASWLDEAELLLGAFGYHYLKQGSWRARAEFIDYVGQAWPEYNRLYAHPFEWTWSSQKMRQWVAEHGL